MKARHSRVRKVQGATTGRNARQGRRGPSLLPPLAQRLLQPRLDRAGDLGADGGIAVHGYPSVPTYNASHGCVRIPMHIADYFQGLVPDGTPMFVVGTRADSTHRFSGPGPGPL